MKKIELLFLCVMLALFGCANPNNDESSDSGTQQNEDETELPETPGAIVYVQEYWGEWLRMDTGEVWRITAHKASYTKSGTSETVKIGAGITLNKLPGERVIEVTEGARKYYLYASRTATGRFTGKIANEAGGSSNVVSAPSANVVGSAAGGGIDGPLFSFGAAAGVPVRARNLTDSTNTVETATDEYGDFAIEGIIPGDEYELSSGGQTTIVRPQTDGSDVGTLTLTRGLNFKTSITPRDAETDMTLLYAKRDANDTESVYHFNINIQNTGNENCLVALFSLSADDGLTILEQPENQILGTIVPGAKKTIPITVSCDTPDAANVLKKIYVTIQGVGRVWNDAVSLRFHKTAIMYFFASASPAQGIVIAPDAKTYHFKTADTLLFNGVCTTTLTMPWSTKDYLVVFSGAALDTETAYSFNVNASPNTNYMSNQSFALANEPENDRETGAARITASQGATGYLHTGDIDYYKVNLGSTAPEANGGAALDTPVVYPGTSTENSITLNWGAVIGASTYQIYRCTAVNGTFLQIASVSGASYTDTGLTRDTIYYYKIRAYTSNIGCYYYSADTEAVSRVTLTLAAGLYKGAAFASAVKIGSQSLEDSLNYISSNAVSGDNYYIVLDANQNSAPKVLYYSNRTVGITLMANSSEERLVQLISNGALFTINSGVTLTLKDNVTLSGRTNNTASLVTINSSGTLKMNGGKISGNTNTTPYSYGGGVFVDGTFTMSGGEISGNKSVQTYAGGGGVCVYSGTFTMSGGKISGNTSDSSSSIYGGGGVFVYNSGTFTMNGGEISGNTSSTNGGGVYISDGIFIKTAAGGVITGYGSDTTNGNRGVQNRGHAVYRLYGSSLNNTVSANKALDSRVSGSSGGWTE